MKTSSSFLLKWPQHIRGALLALVGLSVGTICVFEAAANNPPTLTIAQPAEGASFAGPIDVTIEATVSDSDGFVTKVDFYSNPHCDDTLLGTVTAPPYRFTMNNLTSGSYSIVVSATDNGGAFAQSLVNFSVVGPSAGPIQSLVNAAAPGSTVDIPAGVYLDNVIINKNLTLRGAGVQSTAIDGNNGCAAALVVAVGATVTLRDLTVTRGGILNDGTLTVNDCALTGNLGRSGLYNTIPGSVFMNNCTISGNVITTDGGGIRNDGTMILNTCIISGNAAPNHGGGAIGGIKNLGSLTLSNSEIIGNSTEFGGAGGIENLGTLLLNNCNVTNNFGLLGGGIANRGQATINSSTIDGNEAGGPDGGAGGGLYNGSLLTLNNSTVSDNVVDETSGGGIANAGTLTLNHCTISGNSAIGVFFLSINGGGVMNSGTVNCQNTIIAGNLATRPWPDTTTSGPDFFGTLISQGYNLIGNTKDTVILGITTGNLLNIDPLLGPLQNNGGPTPTRALLPSSPAIDAGISGGLNSDQRGVPRPNDISSLPNAADGSDIGAYEFNGAPPTVSITCPADIAVNNDPGQCSAVVDYPAPLVSGGTGDLVVVCNPPSSSVFPLGTTTVTCIVTDASGNIAAACSFKVTVNDTEPPDASYVVVKPATLRQNPPRIVGWFQLLALDHCDFHPLIYIKGSVGSFVAGPFHSGDRVEISHGPSLIPRQTPITSGGNIASIQLNGDALLWAVDSSGNASTPVKIR